MTTLAPKDFTHLHLDRWEFDHEFHRVQKAVAARLGRPEGGHPVYRVATA